MKRSVEQYSQEIGYLTKHLEERFKHQLNLAQFAQQISQIITERVEEYIYQRYRDWDAIELIDLLSQWKRELEVQRQAKEPYAAIEAPSLEEPKVRTRKAKVVKGSQVL